MYRDSNFCAKSVRYNIFTNGVPYIMTKRWCCDTIRQSDIVIDQGFLLGGRDSPGRASTHFKGGRALFTT